MTEETTDYGYGAVDEAMKEQGSNKYLNFKKGDKGRTIQIRIVSEPRYINQHWITDVNNKQSAVNCDGESCTYCGKSVPVGERIKKDPKWGWIVIDREDGEVKVFTGAMQIAKELKDISELKNMKTGAPMWGDPRNYDVQVTRTEEPGSYYKVNPVAGEEKGPITPEEQAKVDATGYDLQAELVGSKASANTGNYGNRDLETAPDESVDPESIPANLGEEKQEKVDDSEMPF